MAEQEEYALIAGALSVRYPFSDAAGLTLRCGYRPTSTGAGGLRIEGNGTRRWQQASNWAVRALT
jgi:hypothetical protein